MFAEKLDSFRIEWVDTGADPVPGLKGLTPLGATSTPWHLQCKIGGKSTSILEVRSPDFHIPLDSPLNSTRRPNRRLSAGNLQEPNARGDKRLGEAKNLEVLCLGHTNTLGSFAVLPRA